MVLLGHHRVQYNSVGVWGQFSFGIYLQSVGCGTILCPIHWPPLLCCVAAEFEEALKVGQKLGTLNFVISGEVRSPHCNARPSGLSLVTWW